MFVLLSITSAFFRVFAKFIALFYVITANNALIIFAKRLFLRILLSSFFAAFGLLFF